MPTSPRLSLRASWLNHGYRFEPGRRRTSTIAPASASFTRVRNSSSGCVEWPTVRISGSVIDERQRAALVRGDVIGLVARDLVLRVVIAGTMRVPLVVELGGVHVRDAAAHPTRHRVPPAVVSDRDALGHRRLVSPYVSILARHGGVDHRVDSGRDRAIRRVVAQ